jgi:hypothetical protein
LTIYRNVRDGSPRQWTRLWLTASVSCLFRETDAGKPKGRADERERAFELRFWVLGDSFYVAVRWNGNRSSGGRRGIVEYTLVSPSIPFIEPSGSCVASNDRKPRSLVAVRLDEALRFGEQVGCHTGPAVACRYVDLFEFVINYHHEACYCAVDDRNHRVADTLYSTQCKRLLSPGRNEVFRYVPEMAVAPSVIPDLGDSLRIIKTCGTQRHSPIIG